MSEGEGQGQGQGRFPIELVQLSVNHLDVLVGWSIRGVAVSHRTPEGEESDIAGDRMVLLKLSRGLNRQILMVRGQSVSTAKDREGGYVAINFTLGITPYHMPVWRTAVMISDPVPAVMAEVCGMGLEIRKVDPPNEAGSVFIGLDHGFRMVLHAAWMVAFYMPVDEEEEGDSEIDKHWHSPYPRKVQ
jgi:hypothetical protein